MPWLAFKDDDFGPSRYQFPYMSDEVILGHERPTTYAKNKRKECGQIREGLIATQKAIGRDDRENGKWLGQEAADYMKQFRAWDFLVKFMEGDSGIVSWRAVGVSKEVSQYLDVACNELTYGEF